MANVVISYSRTDSKSACELAEFLRSCGYDTWMDVSQLPTGNFNANINKELDTAGAVIVIWTDASCESEWVQAEAGRANELHKLIAVMPRSLSTPIPVPFSSIHTTFLDDRPQIIRALGSLKVPQSLAERAAASAAIAHNENVRKKRRRDNIRLCAITTLVAAAIPIVIAALLGWLLSKRGGELTAEKGARATDGTTIKGLSDTLRTNAENKAAELAKPVSRIVVPYARGGPTHTLAERLARHFTVTFGRRVVAVPWEGQSGIAAIKEVTTSDADGRTLLLHHNGLAYAPAFASDLGFDVSKELEPLGLVNQAPMAIVAHQSLRLKGITDSKTLLDVWRKDPKQLRFGHAGLGSNSHMCVMKIVKALNANNNSPCAKKAPDYCWPNVNPQLGGTGPAWTLMRNWSPGSDEKDRITLICDQINIASKNLEEDDNRKLFGTVVFGSLGLTAPRFVHFKQTEFAQLRPDIESWHGLYVKAGTSPIIMQQINRGLRSFLKTPETVDYFKTFRISMPDNDQIDSDGHRVFLARVIEQAEREVETFGGKRPISKF